MLCHTPHHWVAGDGADHCVRHFPVLQVVWLCFSLNKISNEVHSEESVLLSNLFATLLLQTDGLSVMYSSKTLFSSWVLWDTICAHTDNKRQHIIPRVLETSLMWTDKSVLIRTSRAPVQMEIFNYMWFSLVNAFWQTHLICQYLFKMELDTTDSINDIKIFSDLCCLLGLCKSCELGELCFC